MLLAVDIGNTHTVIGVFDGGELKNQFRLNTDPLATADEIFLKISVLLREAGFGREDVETVMLCSVVPQVTPLYEEMCGQMLEARVLKLGPGIKTGISIRIDNPREVGADRIANAVGGFARFGGPLIIVDLGTAITIDAISEQGEYLGGVIAPGIGASMYSLSRRAAQLPQVGLQKPRRVIGKNTIESMQSGAAYGFAGMVDNIVRRVAEEMGGSPRVLATGGQSGWMMELSGTLTDHEPDLTLLGLMKIAELNA